MSVKANVTIIVEESAGPRIQYGAQRLAAALKQSGTEASVQSKPSASDRNITVQTFSSYKGPWGGPAPAKEGYLIQTLDEKNLRVMGGDDSGALYGCIELIHQLRDQGKLPDQISKLDQPQMVLRGPCIGMQKTYILPGRKVYEYPYTPELFPFFYDKQHWTEYLDFLADNRMNTLYLWNGHPFPSLVKLKDYPYAMEVDDATLAKNMEMYHWITTEADKRGIWVVQMFYNLFVSKPFAEKHNLETQLKAPTELTDDYTRKCLAEFVKQYPNVGLMICMGEALQGIDNQRHVLCDVILPGIRDGMKDAGLKEEPPVVIRTHATDLRQYMTDALKVYKNIYTEAKFNGESLTTYEPRGVRQQVHLAMSKLGSTHLINVHILANLEPFRYNAQRFIQKCIVAGRDRLGARGLHLYPLFYWNWPDSPDIVSGAPLKQWERDWMWFEAWARYAWNPDIDEKTDHAYWVKRLTDKFGNVEAAEKILSAGNDAGECAPRILRRFGITEGNRQTMSLGMTLDELVDPAKYKPFEELWESQAPPGERLEEYMQKEWKNQKHVGETPVSIVKEILEYSKKAVDAIDSAKPTKNIDEFERTKNDIHCIRAMSQFYAAKVNAAMLFMEWETTHDPEEFNQAKAQLAESVEHFRVLTSLTQNTYTAANSMQTSQRRIPVPGGANGHPANYHWTQLLPIYEKELADFDNHKKANLGESDIKPFTSAKINIITPDIQTYAVKIGEKVFTDRGYVIKNVAQELVGLTGIRINHDAGKKGTYEPFEFECDEPVKVLIGYIQDKRDIWLQLPDLETDAAAIDQFEIEPTLRNAVTVDETPAINVHAIKFEKGRHKMDVRGKGSFLILGVIPQTLKVHPRDAHRAGGN